jgi:hypothetical protein
MRVFQASIKIMLCKKKHFALLDAKLCDQKKLQEPNEMDALN